MQCSKVNELMSLRLDGLLDSITQERLDHHLASCQSCEEEWQVLCELSELFQSTPLSVPAPGFAARVTLRVAETRARQELRRGAFLLSGGLLLLLLLTLPSLVGMTMLIGDLSSPTLVNTGISALISLLSALRSVGDAVALLLSASLSTPAAVLAPVYIAIALVTMFVWVHLMLRVRTVYVTHPARVTRDPGK